MDMTLENYILNPMGKKNAVLNATAREAIKSSYSQKFGNIMVREHGIINYRLYKDTKKNHFYAHFKIPSETVDNFYYDVVLKFYTNENVEESGRNLLKYYVKFYSNDPAFVYTYAYVFSHNGLLVDELKPRMSKKALSTKAKEKNPYNQVGYVKTIYFAYLFMLNRGLTNLNRFEAESIEFDKKYLLNNVEDADKKVEEREEEQKKIVKKKKREVNNKGNREPSPDVSKSKKIGVTKTSTSSIKSSSIKKTGSVKNIKRK